MSDRGSITLYAARALAAPGANTNFAAFAMKRPGCGVRITITLTTASVLNLRSTDGTTAYVNGLLSSSTITAGDTHAIDVPSLPKVAPGTTTAMSYALQVETDSVIRDVMIVEMPTEDF